MPFFCYTVKMHFISNKILFTLFTLRDPKSYCVGLEKRIYMISLNNESLYTFLYLLIHILDLKFKCNYINFFTYLIS